jgi:hypothetical protein
MLNEKYVNYQERVPKWVLDDWEEHPNAPDKKTAERE